MPIGMGTDCKSALSGRSGARYFSEQPASYLDCKSAPSGVYLFFKFSDTNTKMISILKMIIKIIKLTLFLISPENNKAQIALITPEKLNR